MAEKQTPTQPDIVSGAVPFKRQTTKAATPLSKTKEQWQSVKGRYRTSPEAKVRVTANQV